MNIIADSLSMMMESNDTEPTALSVTQNGTYTAPSGTAYTPVTVSVSPNVGTKSIHDNGTYTASSDNLDGYSSVTVDTGIYVGTTTPASALGKNGDYYYQRTNTGYGIKNHHTLSSSQQTTLGYEFIPKQDIMLTGLRGYLFSTGASFTVSIGTLSEILYTTESSTSSVGGWNDVMLDEPIKLNANQHYVVMVSSSLKGRYVSVADTTISDLIIAVGGRYGTYPGTSDTDNLYLADIIFESDIYTVDKQYIKKSGSWVEL